VNLDLARAGLGGGFTDYARAHLNHVVESGFPAADVESAVNDFFSSDLGAARKILRPLLLQSEALTESTDFEAMQKEYLAVRDRFAALQAESRLSALAEEAIELGRQRLVRETDVTFARFSDADAKCFNGNAVLVEEWNKNMALHNGGLSRYPQLSLISKMLTGRREELNEASRLLEEYVRSAKRGLAGLECLRTVARDAGEKVRKNLETTIQKENEAIARARQELKKTREHYERNQSGMASQVGG
jgi:hypothetical protein